MFVDSHVHFPEDPAQANHWVDRALAADVQWMLAVGGSPSLNAGALSTAKTRPGAVALALGWDRSQAAVLPPRPDDALPAEWFREPIVAIGEIGLDYHYEREQARAQCLLFARQLDAALQHGLPVVTHCRAAEHDFLAILDEALRVHRLPPGGLGVLHCFTGDTDFAHRLLDRGMFISFSGILTFRNAGPLRATAAGIPSDRLLVETDAPYLSPVPLRGKPNEPAHVVEVARCLAGLRGLPVDRLCERIRANAQNLFARNLGIADTPQID